MITNLEGATSWSSPSAFRVGTLIHIVSLILKNTAQNSAKHAISNNIMGRA